MFGKGFMLNLQQASIDDRVYTNGLSKEELQVTNTDDVFARVERAEFTSLVGSQVEIELHTAGCRPLVYAIYVTDYQSWMQEAGWNIDPSTLKNKTVAIHYRGQEILGLSVKRKV